MHTCRNIFPHCPQKLVVLLFLIMVSTAAPLFVTPSVPQLRRTKDATTQKPEAGSIHCAEREREKFATSPPHQRDSKWCNDFHSESILSFLSILKDGNLSTMNGNATIIEHPSFCNRLQNDSKMTGIVVERSHSKPIGGMLVSNPFSDSASSQDRSLRCVHNQCQRIAIYGNAVPPPKSGARYPRYCASHRRSNDVDFRSKRCQHPDGCLAPATYGERGGEHPIATAQLPSAEWQCAQTGL